MKLNELKKQFKNQWILAEVLKRNPETKEITDVKIIEHSPRRSKTYKAMEKTNAKYIAHFYNGAIPKKGYAVAFQI